MTGTVTGVDTDYGHIAAPVVYFIQADEGVAVRFWRTAHGG
jgi:hypothetical protein